MRQGHCLDLVMRDIDGGDAKRGLHMLELGAHVTAQLGVEIRQGLVHKEHRRPADDRARQGNALTLAAGQFARIALEKRFQLHLLRGIQNGRVHLLLRQLFHLQRKPDILGNRLVRIEGVRLEYHRDVTIFRQYLGNVPLADIDLPRAWRLEPGEDAQRRRLARSGSPEKHQEFPGLHLQVEFLQHLHAAEAFLHCVKFDRGLCTAVRHVLPLHGAKKDAL